ncbi:MAG TPA: hypothetical protein GXX49_10325 [Clostridiaceae bacterium]|nr:hypothetical protein [Clostridiaceae bacterium]
MTVSCWFQVKIKETLCMTVEIEAENE